MINKVEDLAFEIKIGTKDHYTAVIYIEYTHNYCNDFSFIKPQSKTQLAIKQPFSTYTFRHLLVDRW